MNDFESLLAGLAKRSQAREEPGDYHRDGLLYCGKCGTPKQCRVEVGKDSLLAGCMCRCAEDAYQAERRAAHAVEESMRINDLRVQGIQDRAMRAYTFQRAEETANIAKCRRYAEQWRDMREANCGLLLAGPPGTGKTFAAACIANALISRGVPVLVTSFPRILNSGGWDKTELSDQMKVFDLLVLDDLGTERKDRGGAANGYALEIMQMVVDERYKTGKPLIVTTNLSKSQMDQPEDMDCRRIFDRLNELCVPLYFGGPSWREKKAGEKRRLAREALA